MQHNSPRYTFRLLRAGTFKLDGGSMFGIIPRVVWSKSCPHDDKGRITVAHNCLLLERVDPASSASSLRHSVTSSLPQRILIEAGSGDKLEPKMREVFDLELNPAGHANAGRPRSIHDCLAEIGVTPESIDAAVVTHLHFDHAGGLTRLARPGERPTWPVPPNNDGGGGSSQTGGCVPTFPNARIYVQQREWNDAVANRSTMTKTYYPDHLFPIADKIRGIDSPRPFPTNFTADRDDLPRTTVEMREIDPFAHLLPRNELPTSNLPLPTSGISVFLTPGHTWGQQAIKFTEPDSPAGKGRTIVFTPDVLPTVHHAGAAYNLAYDVEPYTSTLTRRWLLTEAAARDWVLCLDHEPGHPLVRVRANTKGWFDLISEPF